MIEKVLCTRLEDRLRAIFTIGRCFQEVSEPERKSERTIASVGERGDKSHAEGQATMSKNRGSE